MAHPLMNPKLTCVYYMSHKLPAGCEWTKDNFQPTTRSRVLITLHYHIFDHLYPTYLATMRNKHKVFRTPPPFYIPPSRPKLDLNMWGAAPNLANVCCVCVCVWLFGTKYAANILVGQNFCPHQLLYVERTENLPHSLYREEITRLRRFRDRRRIQAKLESPFSPSQTCISYIGW